MIVAVQKGLDNMKASLRELGHDVVDYGDYKYPVDAIVYMGGDGGFTMSTDISGPAMGVFLINAKGKTPQEVDAMLKRRLYTPLF